MRLPGTRYCPSCGQDVALDAALEGAYLLTSCANCGLGLGLKVASTEESHLLHSAPPPSATATPAPRLVPAAGRPPERRPPPSPGRQAVAPLTVPGAGDASGEAFASVEVPSSPPSPPPGGSGDAGLGGPVRQMRSVFLVEDSTFLRQVTRDLLTSRNLARDVVECDNGVTFIEEMTRAVAAGRKPDLVILDVRMPEADGREIAYALRAVEVGLGVKRTPILFFSAVLCDEAFKQVLAELGNAKYIRKGDTSDVNQLGERIVAVLERLVGTRK